MATYNGEKFLKEQVDSILGQLGPDDELVVSDDGSSDRTLDILSSYKDKRIKIFEGPKKGIKQNFGNAISKCSGEIIFLSDQDDVWMSDKVAEVLGVFRKEDCQCVVHDCVVFDSDSGKVIYPSFFKWRGSRAGKWKNIWKNSYIGCCMAFRAEMRKYILPIPDNIEMHDQWIGIICEKHGEGCFLKKKLIQYRRHGGNQTEMRRHGMMKMLRNRIVLLVNLAEARRK
ncbi:glycosyltransferase family 2 protein [Candidatus Saccharibacteria bacterium]|nr:glycosyltransferase family 2 protein [Candidatus Saccharibacteria bacterium]